MPHIKTNARYYTTKQFIVYVIVSPFRPCVYVGKTLKHAVKNHYTSHYNLRNRCTKELFSEAKTKDLVPKMYLLEELEMAEADAYRHCVAWIRFFVDKGFESLAQKATNEYAANLLPETKSIYEKIRQASVEEVLCDDHILVDAVREYRSQSQKSEPDDTTFIGFRVSQKESEIIRNAAEKKQRSVSEYCRAAAVDGCIVNVDFNFMWRYMRELMGVKSLLQQLIFTIHETGKYYPQDLTTIQAMVDTVIKHEKKMNEEMTAMMKKTRKEIRGAKRDLK